MRIIRYVYFISFMLMMSLLFLAYLAKDDERIRTVTAPIIGVCCVIFLAGYIADNVIGSKKKD